MEKNKMEETLGAYCNLAEASKPVIYANETKVPKARAAKCPDCDLKLDVPLDAIKGEIVSCPGCGLELEVKYADKEKVDLQELTIDGEDWGE